MEVANSKIFNWILGLSALAVSGMAAFFSVTGIAMLFSGSFLAVALMATSLEVGKLVTASFLYRYWKVVNWIQKTYMTIATIILIGITSMGIFGFLSNSYMGATVEFDTMFTKLSVYKEQLVTMEEDKVFLKDELETSVNGLPDNYITAKRKLREEYNPLIQEKSIQIGEIKNNIGQLEIEMVDTGIDVGPLLYISEAFGTDMDTAVKWIMFVLIVVFDPLAVMLIISLNIVLVGGRKVEVHTPLPAPPINTYGDDDWATPPKEEVISTEALHNLQQSYRPTKNDDSESVTEKKEEVVEEEVVKEVVKKHIKDKIADAVKVNSGGNPLERWKQEMEKKIGDDNYPLPKQGKGIPWEGRDKDINAKTDDYDDKLRDDTDGKQYF